MIVPLPFESSYVSTRSPVDSQQTLNVFPHSQRGYRDYPGLVEFGNFQSETEAVEASDGPVIASDGPVLASTYAGGADRGMWVMNGVLYAVSGPSLYSIDSFGVSSYIGAIAGDDFVVMSDNGTQLTITTGTTTYHYTTGGGLVTNADGDLGAAWTNDYLDSRTIYDQADGQFVVSDLDDSSAINALNFATAERYPDDLLRVKTLNRLVYFFGERSTEVWYTSGVGRPPLDPQTSIEHGAIGRWAVDSIDDLIYFIDHNRRPSIILGTQYQPIAVTSALGEEWDSYDPSAMDDAKVVCYSHQQESFVDFVIPAVSKTWTYHAASRTFFERTFKTVSIKRAYNKTLAADFENGKIYDLSSDVSANDGDAITRRKDSPIITGESVGAPGRSLIMDALFVSVQTSSSAEISVYFSKDLTTFINPRTFTADGNVRHRLSSFGSFHEGIIRIETSANAKVDILDLSADLDIMDG